jgi:signal peptidase I
MQNNSDTEVVPSMDTRAPIQKSKLRQHAENAWDLIKFAAIALAIVIPIRLFIAQPFVVSGLSMFPTFNDGQYLIVDEISYLVKGPTRGDVVIFRYPNDPSRFFIKRMIGMPNETIQITNGVVTIFNKQNPTGFTLHEPYIDQPFSTTQTYTTGPDQYFVMGDNRNQSSDSRYWGLVPKKLLIGRAYLRLLPLKTAAFLPGAFMENK